MKKFSLFICILFSLTAQAQTIRLGFGLCQSQTTIQAYVPSLSIYNSPILYFNAPMRSYAGFAGLEIFDSKTFSVSPEIFFYQTGANYSKRELQRLEGYRPPDKPDKVLISYTSVQLLGNINTWTAEKKIKVQLQIGPRIDFVKENNIDLHLKALYFSNTVPPVQESNYGISGGLAIYYDGFKHLQLGLRGLYFLQAKPTINFSYWEGDWLAGALVEDNPILLNFSLGYKIGNRP